MQSVKETFFKALKNFPSWSNIRKRPQKSTGALYLASIIEEQELINEELQKYIDDFFLITYVGREDKLIDYVYSIQIGDVEYDRLKLPDTDMVITESARLFVESPDEYCIYQNGYLIVKNKEALTVEGRLVYSIDDFHYSLQAEKTHIWNVIDEFALFLGLERFEDETNKHLMKRCFAVFQKPANSTEVGIKNAIINSVMNDDELDEDEIIIEKIDEHNIKLEDSEAGEIYEKLSQLNKDVFRTKVWDMDTWEHDFKTLIYLPHEWDKEIELAKDGVGQGEDLKVYTHNGENDTTDVKIAAYKADRNKVMEYIQASNISTDISLGLTKYSDQIKAVDLQYRISASPVEKIDPRKIYFSSKKIQDGLATYYLKDIVSNPKNAEVVDNGLLSTPGKYRLRFFPKTDYCDMEIEKANLISGDGVTSLLSPQGAFGFNDKGQFINKDSLLHVTRLNQAKLYSHFVNGKTCIEMDGNESMADIAVDITGMDGQFVTVATTSSKENIITNSAYVNIKDGFSLTQSNTLKAEGGVAAASSAINVKCNYLELTLMENEIKTQQGAAIVTIMIDGVKDEVGSGVWNTPRKYILPIKNYCSVRVEIQKIGTYPVEFKDILARRYQVITHLDYDELIRTPFGDIIPDTGKKNSLRVKINNYGTTTPKLEYIHVGPALTNASYTTEEFTSDGNMSLDVVTGCRVQLLKSNGKTNELIKDNYQTAYTYSNKTKLPILLEVDISDFDKILESSKPISRTVSAGREISYITLKAGESLSSIEVEGLYNKTCSKDSLYNILGLAMNQDVYISKNVNGFIVKDTKTNREWLTAISRKQVPTEAESFYFENIPTAMTGYFIIDEANNTAAKKAYVDNNFENAYIMLNDAKSYVANNKISMLNSREDDIPLSNTFSPVLDTNQLMCYSIEESNIPSANVLFRKAESGVSEYATWSLGIKQEGITIELDLDYNNYQQYDLGVSNLTKQFAISNSIELDNAYEISGEPDILARYIITPPKDLDVCYRSEAKTEEITILNDGFNKLYFSNVESIQKIVVGGESLPVIAYSLLKDGGIVIWNKNASETGFAFESLVGMKAQVTYKYKVPYALKYNNIESLYKLAEYSVEAYALMAGYPKRYTDMSAGQEEQLAFTETPTKIVLECDNPNFKASVSSDNRLIVRQVINNNSLGVKPGYYYDDGEEYYFFASKHIEDVDNSSSVTFTDTSIYGGELHTDKASSNYVRNSAFRTEDEDVVCHIRCANNEHINSASLVESMTACESYNLWQMFNMDSEIMAGLNGNGISFVSKDENSYALLEITDIAKEGNMISLFADGDITLTFMSEVLVNAVLAPVSMSKSIFCSEVGKFKQEGKDKRYQYFVFPKDTAGRKYVMVTGSGLIDDIIIKKYEEGTDRIALHKKVIDRLKFDIKERLQSETLVSCEFDANGNKFNNVEIRKDGYLITAMSIDWGLTKIYDISEDFESCKINNIVRKNEAFYADDKSGSVTTPVITLPNYSSINRIVVKVNDVIINNFDGVSLNVFTAEEEDGKMKQVEFDIKDNLLTVSKNKLFPYIQVVAEMPKSKVINSIEIYAEYAEGMYAPKAKEANYGELVSKVYDLGTAANYSFSLLDGIIENDVNIFMRGLRKDSQHHVWTDWYEIYLDATGKAVRPHEFENYKMFQFKVYLGSKKSKAKINNFILEVTS